MTASPRTRALAALLLVEVLLVAVFTWLAGEVVGARTMAFDLRVRNAIHEQANPPLTDAMIGVTFLGGAYVIVSLAIVLCVSFWRAGLQRPARLLAIAVAGEIAIEYSLKLAFHRARPEPFFGLSLPSGYSFPSGHAMATLIFYGTLAALLTPRLTSRAVRWLLWLAAGALAAAIGFSRVYLGVHYPTDVLGGYLAGLIWVVALAIGVRLKV